MPLGHFEPRSLGYEFLSPIDDKSRITGAFY